MSSFTPRVWKTQTAPEAEYRAELPPGKFHAYRHDKPNNLPIASTAFIGRERDVAEVRELQERYRLVTLVGSGGVGKTRLAVQAGTELLERYPDGVWFADLAPIADPELVASVIAQALGMNQQQGRRVDEAIPLWLKHKRMLLIFDNCEHVVDTVAPIVAAILRTAPDVRIIATSRQALDVAGEIVHRVPSLPVSGAIALFADRATAADSRFVLTDDNAPTVAEICRRLDGIPLAIELAAARVKVLSIPHLAERLSERFKLLTGGSRDVLPRQKTLHALIDWSYELLGAQEQLLFARIGIFSGGFALDAVTSVCGGNGLDELDILDLLGSLTAKSLVVADTSGEHERYRLLESTTAYALEKLRASGEHETLARRHAQYFREQADMADDRFGTGSRATWVAAVELELDNYRGALTWTLTQGNDVVVGGAIAGALAVLWRDAGLAVEGRYWIERAVEAVNEAEQPRIAARLQLALSVLFSGKHRHDAAERAMRLYAATDDARGAARAQQGLAFGLFQMGEIDAANTEIARGLALARACGDAWSVANALNQLAIIEWNHGHVAAAREGYMHALASYKALEDETGTALVLTNLAELAFSDGHAAQALTSIGESLEIALHGKNATPIAISYVNGAAYRLALGDLAGARESAREGLRAAQKGRVQFFIAIALQHLALLSVFAGDARRAALLLGYVDARFAELGNKREYTEQWSYDKILAALRETLNDDQIATLSAEGAAWSEDRAVEEALLV